MNSESRFTSVACDYYHVVGYWLVQPILEKSVSNCITTKKLSCSSSACDLFNSSSAWYMFEPVQLCACALFFFIQSEIMVCTKLIGGLMQQSRVIGLNPDTVFIVATRICATLKQNTRMDKGCLTNFHNYKLAMKCIGLYFLLRQYDCNWNNSILILRVVHHQGI